METFRSLRQLLVDMPEKVQQLAEAYEELNGHVAKEAEFINRMDRIADINALKARLIGEVDRIRNEETSSEHAFNTGKVFSGMLNFAAGSLTSAALKQKNPLSFGYKLATKEFGKKDCFGTVMMALKKDGKFKDIETIAISRLAREAKTAESDIMSSFKNNGYSLMTPGELWIYLDYVKETIKEGKG